MPFSYLGPYLTFKNWGLAVYFCFGSDGGILEEGVGGL